jgi:cell wall-associated NlpC family hydrolase
MSLPISFISVVTVRAAPLRSAVFARAKRFAAALNTAADRERFEKMAADYRSELDALESVESQSSAAPTASKKVAPTDDAAAAEPQNGGSEATSPTPPTRIREHSAPS